MTTSYAGHLDLPDHVIGTPDQRKGMRQIADATFGFEVDIEWQTATKPYRVIFNRTPHCPRIVHFVDLQAEIEACKKGEVFIGLDPRSNPYVGSFLHDDPHWLFEVISRRGKSTFLSFTIAQLLHQDPLAMATGIDVKRESFKALFGVPRFSLANDPGNIEAMWDLIGAFREEMDRRCAARALDPTLEFSYNILAIDEISQFSAASKFLWDDIKGKGDRSTPPVWRDITAIAFQGAAFHCHLILAGQRADDRVLGGAGLIGSFGFRGLAGYRTQAWMRLIGTAPVPRLQGGKGRWIYVQDGSETWVQNVLASDAEIKAWAMSCPADHEALSAPVSLPDPLMSATTWLSGDKAAAEHLGLPVGTFSKRRQRRPIPGEQRNGKTPTWTPADLDSWAGAQHPDTAPSLGHCE